MWVIFCVKSLAFSDHPFDAPLTERITTTVQTTYTSMQPVFVAHVVENIPLKTDKIPQCSAPMLFLQAQARCLSKNAPTKGRKSE